MYNVQARDAEMHRASLYHQRGDSVAGKVKVEVWASRSQEEGLIGQC